MRKTAATRREDIVVPRYLPGQPFPPYAYVPGGRHPHPERDPAGHSHGRPAPVPLPRTAPDPAKWRECRAFLYGVDLFNHGYYWEAHEAWEGLWHLTDGAAPAARMLQALIKLAAAGVKLREGRPRGVARHAAKAAAHLQDLDPAVPVFGLRPGEVTQAAATLAKHAEAARLRPG